MEAYRNRLDKVRAALWGMKVKEHHRQGLYAENVGIIHFTDVLGSMKRHTGQPSRPLLYPYF